MGKNKGKAVGKAVFTVAGFFIGGLHPSIFGVSKFLPGAIMGASLGGTLWSLATARKKGSSLGSSIQKFDKAMNTISSTGAIQVVYGTRLVEGNQTYHKPNPELNMLDKHVVLCEGGIGGILSVMAAGLPIPIINDGNETSVSAASKTVFTIVNTKYEDASVQFAKKWSNTEDEWHYTMTLVANGQKKSVFIGGLHPISIPPYQAIKIDSQFSGGSEYKNLFNCINGLGDGWKAENYNAIDSGYRLTDIKLGTYECYQTAMNVEIERYNPSKSYDNSQKGGVIFTVGNTKHSDAQIVISDHKMYLKQGGATFKEIKLGEAEDYDNSDYAQYELDIGTLVSYINRVGEGWVAFPFASTNRLPHDLYDVEAACYNKYVEIRADNAKGETYYTYHDGDVPQNYADVGSYRHCAWLDMHFTVSDELNGNPNIDVVVQGRKVYDTRTKKTEYSTNPAMCLRDFLLNEVFGIGWEGGLDEESFMEAADYCDEQIAFFDSEGVLHRRKRYELNLILSDQEDAEDAVAKFLSACCGFLIRYKGIIGMRIEKKTPASYHFTENQIVKDTFAISQIGLDETPNRYVINIISPENNWRATRCIVEDTAMQKELNTIQEESVDLDGVTSYQQALRIGRLYRDLNTVCNKTISFSTASQAMHLQPGDVILVSYYKAIEKMPFRILSMKEEANGTFTIEGREYCEDIYSDELGAVIHSEKYTSTSLEEFNAKIRLGGD